MTAFDDDQGRHLRAYIQSTDRRIRAQETLVADHTQAIKFNKRRSRDLRRARRKAETALARISPKEDE